MERRTCNKRGPYSKYSLEDLERAIAEARSGKSIQGTAKRYNIPRKTLSDHVSGRSTIERRPGRQLTIPKDVENLICQKVLSAAEAGFPLTKKQFLLKVGNVARKLGLKTPFKNGIPGKDFWYSLKKRHPELTIRTPQNCASNRLSMTNRTVVDRYFDQLQELLDNLGLKDKPQQIWNCDETGLSFCPDASTVVAKKGVRTLVARCSPTKENITTLACINAAGGSMPPLCVVKGKTKRSLYSFATDEAPDGTYWTFQENAWMNDEIGVHWFQDVFLEHCGSARPQILILDSHHSHEVLELLEMAKEENISIFALPPHTTHILQPLDRVVFKPLKTKYREVCTEFLSDNSDRIINKVTWPGLLNKTWDSIMRPDLLARAFEATGIYPTDRSRIPDLAFSPGEMISQTSSAPPPNEPEKKEAMETQEVDVILEMEDISFLNNLVIDLEGENITIGELASNTPSANWTEAVEDAFQKGVASQNSRRNNKSRAIKGSRLLTSNIIIQEKREDAEKKESAEKAKAERKERKKIAKK